MRNYILIAVALVAGFTFIMLVIQMTSNPTKFDNPDVRLEPTKKIRMGNTFNVYEVEYDGCIYFVGEHYGNHPIFLHKGNCPNHQK